MESKALVLLASCMLIVIGCSKAVTPPETAASATPAATPVSPDGHPMMRLPTTTTEWAHGAMRFAGLGNVHRPITTRSPEAQMYFD
jgi:hypothetical protein